MNVLLTYHVILSFKDTQSLFVLNILGNENKIIQRFWILLNFTDFYLQNRKPNTYLSIYNT